MITVNLLSKEQAEIAKAIKAPDEAEFLTLCSSFTQYTGKKIGIKFLEKYVHGNKFIEVQYDEYMMHFTNPSEMTDTITRFMYADLKDKIKTDNENGGRRTH